MIKRITHWVIGALLTAVYVFTMLAPFGDLMGLPQMGFAISPSGWFWLFAGVVLPPIVYALALIAGRKRTAVVRLMLLATGLLVVALLQLELLLLVPLSSFFA